MVKPKIQHVNCDTLKTTLAIIKPDAMKHEKKILQNFLTNGFHIIQRKKFQLSPELAADFYKYYEKCKTYMILVLNLSNGPIEAVILTKVNAIYDLLDLLGPEKPSEARHCNPLSLRSIFGDCEDDYKNAIHGSADTSCARREINFFFPNFVVEPILIEVSKQICFFRHDIIEKVIEGIFDATKAKPDELKTWLANWFLDNNPNRPIICTTDDKPPTCVPVIKRSIINYDKVPNDNICQIIPKHQRCGLNPCPDCIDQSEKIDLQKFLCCCNAEIQPTEIVNCPICDKVIVYSAPCGVGAKKKIQSSSDLTTSSLTSSSSVMSSCKCIIQEKICPTSSSTSCKCDVEKQIGECQKIKSSTISTCSSSTSTKECNCNNNNVNEENDF